VGGIRGDRAVENVVEEIVGEIRDDFDVVDREPSIDRRDDGYTVDGGVPSP